MFNLENDSFPKEIDDVTRLFCDERSFEVFLLDQGLWFWRQFGIKIPSKNANQTPDLISRVNYPKKIIPFHIEVEHAAKNFIRHRHDPINIHLILSVWGVLGYNKIKNIPVVALYRRCPDRVYRYSLEDDIGVIFHDKQSCLLEAHGGYGDPDDEEIRPTRPTKKTASSTEMIA